MREKSRQSCRATLFRVAALCILLPGPVLAQDGGSESSPAVSSVILDLQVAADPEVRRDAAATLSGLGSPAAVRALQAAVSRDPEPSVRVAAAAALGSMGFQARAVVPDLIRALQDLESPPAGGPPVCSAAAKALGELGRYALAAIGPLARSSPAGCGDTAAVNGALVRMAREFERIAPSLSLAEQEGTLGAFQEAREILGGTLPAEALQSLDGVQRQIRTRKLGWLYPAITVGAATATTLVSAARSVSGILAGIAVLVLLALLLKNVRRVFPVRLPESDVQDSELARLRSLEDWLRRPGAIIDRLEATPISMVSILMRRARETGVVLEVEEVVAEEAWEAFTQSAGGGVIPSSAAAFWLEDTLRKAQEGRGFSPPATIAEAAAAEVRCRIGSPPGPSKEVVEGMLQALAWEAVRRGQTAGWVPLDPVTNRFPGGDMEAVLAHAEGPMGALDWDRRRSRVQFVLDEETTTRLGTRHLLTALKARPDEILAHLGDIHREAVSQGDRRHASAHLRRVARALLDVAQSLEEEAPDLGIAEEALTSLAASGRVEDGVVESSGSSSAGTDHLGTLGSTSDVNPAATARLNRLLGRLDTEAHPSVRERIITVMGTMGPEARRALPVLASAVDKEPPGVALAALDAMGKIGPGAADAAPLLMEVLEKGRPMHRLAATRALGRIGPSGEAAAPTLLSWVSSEGVPHELRTRAVEALGGMPGYAETALPTLTELLRSPVAAEVQQAAILALARLDTGRRDVDEVFARARKSRDPALKGMLAVAILIRDDRLGKNPRTARTVPAAAWAIPMATTAGILAMLQLGAVAGSELLSPGTVLPALFVGPALAFLGGIAYAVATRRLPLHPALGSGVTGWGGASTGLLMGFLISTALSPLSLVIGGGLALGSGAFGGVLVHTALTEL